MSNHALLNNIDHIDLKINIDKSELFGNNTMHSVIFPFEFKHAQADYPIFFHKNNETHSYTAIALFGFQEHENLFLNNGEWLANYIPMLVEREPFLIGYQNQIENGKTITNPVIHIDLDSPRVNKEQGVDIFLPHGGNSDYINKIGSILNAIDENKTSTDLFMNTLVEYDLFEPFNLDIQLKNGSNNRLSGFYTINEEKLSQLDGTKLEALNKSGLLMLIYMVIASHANINALIVKKDNKI